MAKDQDAGTLSRHIRRGLACSASILTLMAVPTALTAENPFVLPDRGSFNSFGMNGLIDMPTAEMMPDGDLSTSISHAADATRTTLRFQLLPRVGASFRYSAIKGLVIPNSIYDGTETYYDRSFDLSYQLLTETDRRPSVTVGLQDFIGTGVYGAEYIVASKEIAPGLRVSGGLGWGRLGSHGAIATTGSRPAELIGQGGVPTYDQWFRGDVAPFGGIEWQATKQLRFKAEYSSDAYAEEVASGLISRDSSWNFGVDYTFDNGNQLSVYALHGSEIGASLSLPTNPRFSATPGGVETAPTPVRVRTGASARDLGWVGDTVASDNIRGRMKTSLEREGLIYEAIELSAHSATLRMGNPRYQAEPQALGRAARVMTRVLPGSIENFTIVPVANGMELAAITFKRSDLEGLENAPAEELLQRVAIEDGFGRAPDPEADLYPKLTWGLAPYLAVSVFDPDNPVRADVGLRLSGLYHLSPNFELSGAVTKKLVGNLDAITRTPTASTLPRVRTDRAQYSREGDPAIEHLTLSYFGRPGENLYSRVTAGYLETMYAGVSGEVLWKPVDSNLALGVELNYARQRDFDQLFGLRSFDTYTGHASAYYNFGNGFLGQVDAGRYLAGDYGATFTLTREFANGFAVGAYATFTDVDFDDFGEGSFDKGIHVTIPLGWALGDGRRKANSTTIQSLTRDGGARLNVRDRLYGRVRDYHRLDLTNEWGRVWR